MKGFLSVIVTAAVLVFPTTALAELTFFSDRGAFDAANPGLPVEDFEEARVPPTGVIGFSGPLSSLTSNAVFQPGEILPGLVVQERPPRPGQNGLAATAPPFGGTTSKALFANFFDDTLDLMFPDNNTLAVGMNLLSLFDSGTVDISIFGAGGLLETTSAVANQAGTAFFGVTSAEAITRINLSSRSGQGEGVDNVAFGTPIPEPATFTLLGVGILSLLGYGYGRRK